MYYLGLDLGSSSIKVALIDTSSGKGRAVEIGTAKCNDEFLNSPSNFTASKLKWGKESSRVNHFAHVNHSRGNEARIGKLLCINGAGIQYRWLLNNLAVSSDEEMNNLAAEISIGSDGIVVNVIRAGNDNLSRSDIFANTIATLIEHEIEIYNTTRAIGAARACSLHTGDFKSFGQKIMDNDHVMTFMPFKDKHPYLKAYQKWKMNLT